VGGLADRRGERWALPAGLAGVALALLVAAAAEGYVLFLAGLCLAGAAGGVTTTGARAASAWFGPARRARAVSLVITGISLGGAVGALLLPIVARGVSVSTAFLGLAGASAGAALSLAIVLRPAPGGDGAPSSGHEYLRSERFWLLALGTAAATAASVGVLSYVPLYFHEERGLGTIAAAAVLAASYLAMSGLRVANGAVADALGARILPAAATCGLGALFLIAFAIALAGSTWVAVIAAVASTAIAFGANGLTATAAAESVPAGERGRALAVRQTLVLGGGALAPIGFGAAVSAWSYGLAITISAMVAALGAALLLAARRAPLGAAQQARSAA